MKEMKCREEHIHLAICLSEGRMGQRNLNDAQINTPSTQARLNSTCQADVEERYHLAPRPYL